MFPPTVHFHFGEMLIDMMVLVQVFYRVHVVGAILFVCFGIVHSRKVFVFFGPGLVLYGIDVAYRWLQASYDVILHVNPGSKLVSIVIPLEVRMHIHHRITCLWAHSPLKSDFTHSSSR